MKTPRQSLAVLYVKWANAGWSALTGRPPGPSSELPPKAAQAAANQEWEAEGGSVKPAETPGAQPEPKIPL
jgi:hypothetical protein